MTVQIPAPPASLRDTLSRSALEAQRIAQGLHRIDAALGALMHVPDTKATAALQAADLLRQEVEGLAAFLTVLARQTDPHLSCDLAGAVAPLGLRAQALRLTGAGPAPQPAPADDLWGHAGA